MRYRYIRWNWHDPVIGLLAALIVYPDKFLDWVGERTGRAFVWWHVLLVEVVAVGLMILSMVLLIPANPALQWWYPLLFIGMLGLIRATLRWVTNLFGLDD